MKEDALLGRDLALVVHGNRMLSAMTFRTLPVKRFGDPAYDLTKFTDTIALSTVRSSYARLKQELDTDYANAIIPTLFKNLSKCTALFKKTEVVVATSKKISSSDSGGGPR